MCGVRGSGCMWKMESDLNSPVAGIQAVMSTQPQDLGVGN